MEFNSFISDFRGIKLNNAMLISTNLVLVALLSVSLFINFQKETIVTNNLNESCSVQKLTKSWMSEQTHKRLGFHLSSLLGNITPSDAEFVKGSVMSFIAPDIYQSVSESIESQLNDIVEDEVSISFLPQTTIFEDDIVFITGQGKMTGPTGQNEKFIRTYEFEFQVENYTPMVRYINVYNDVAHDSVWKRKHQNDEDR